MILRPEGTHGVRLFSLARHALVEGLRMLGDLRGKVILVPEFICRDLLAPIHIVQGRVVFYPVTPELTPARLPDEVDAKAIIAVNYFGFPQDLQVFHRYCTMHGAVLIEDNAHGSLSRDEKGNPLGSRGDFGLVSFRKTFAVPNGAALYANKEKWAEVLPPPLQCSDSPLQASFRVKRALQAIQSSTGIPIRSWAEKLARCARWIRTGNTLPRSSEESERNIPGDAAIHCQSVRILTRVDEKKEAERRRRLYERFSEELRHLDIAPIFERLPDGTVPCGYPFRGSERQAKSVAHIALRYGLNCFQWPDLPAAVKQDCPGFYGNVWWLNFAC